MEWLASCSAVVKHSSKKHSAVAVPTPPSWRHRAKQRHSMQSSSSSTTSSVSLYPIKFITYDFHFAVQVWLVAIGLCLRQLIAVLILVSPMSSTSAATSSSQRSFALHCKPGAHGFRVRSPSSWSTSCKSRSMCSGKVRSRSWMLLRTRSTPKY